MKTNPVWLIITVVMGFLGFMMGYSVPPFMEVGFGVGGQQAEEGQPVSEDMMKHYQQLYQDDDSDDD